ncbi:MAG: YihY/virulence factor BrkB family protein [Clostridiaceae bacterium]
MTKVIGFFGKFIKKIVEDDCLVYAYKLTYGLLLALFPFFIFLFTLIAYLKLDSSYILRLLQQNLPTSIYEAITSQVLDLVQVQRSGLLSLSVFLTIYTASGGFRAFMNGINNAMNSRDDRNVIFRYLSSIFWVILLAIGIVLSLIGIVFGEQLMQIIVRYIPSIPIEGVLNLFRIIVPFALIFVILTLFYMFIPAYDVKLRHAFPGAVFSTIAWIAVTVLLQYYINNFGNYSKFYGALGAVIALMLWLLWTSIVMIIGASLNSFLIEIKEVENPYLRFRTLKNRKKQDSMGVKAKISDHQIKEDRSKPSEKFDELKKSIEDTLTLDRVVEEDSGVSENQNQNTKK